MPQPRYSKRHYEDVARIFKDAREGNKKGTPDDVALELLESVEDAFMKMFADDNAFFCPTRFMVASGRMD